jgi:hypothetical protein
MMKIEMACKRRETRQDFDVCPLQPRVKLGTSEENGTE